MTCDLDGPEFYEETYPKARKDHHCCECRRLIPKGTKYARCSGKWDGDVMTFPQHIGCRDFAAELNREYGKGWCFIAFSDLHYSVLQAADWAEPADALSIQERWEKIRQGMAA